MVKVLVVENSTVAQALLAHVLESDRDIRVVGHARDGEEAIAMVADQKPDVVTMDLDMPRMGGIEATRRIMASTPVPIVVVSGNWNPAEVAVTFEALEAGAVALLEKPPGVRHKDHSARAAHIRQTVRAMAEVWVIRRRRGRALAPQKPTPRPALPRGCVRLVAIGASTGGPPALKQLIGELPKDFAAAVLVVQHLSPGFLPGLRHWLDSFTPLDVRIATADERPLPGCVYLAPDGRHMGLGRSGRIQLRAGPPLHSLRPSVTSLFQSLNGRASEVAAVLLTGMGKDGAEAMKVLRDRGATTFAQDEASSVVFGMPGKAVELGAAQFISDPSVIGQELVALVANARGKAGMSNNSSKNRAKEAHKRGAK